MCVTMQKFPLKLVKTLLTTTCFRVHVIQGVCFTNVSRAPQNNLAKIYKARNDIYSENFRLKLCTCAQSMALGTRTKFQLEILIRSTISAIHKFQENILESSRNVSETTPRACLTWIPETTRWKYIPNTLVGNMRPWEPKDENILIHLLVNWTQPNVLFH